MLQGRHAGRRLSSLDRTELDALLAELPADDRRSRWLLNAYIARRFQGSAETPPTVDRPDEEEAWRILGLQPGADRDEILRAHKRLMQRLHPDRGGND
ncbi:MAG: molecular chaperone DnaJ, partial [Planctomycetes bacterium]|nr:molecular chaperone DnaJ [Planctomycetota bacterium]